MRKSFYEITIFIVVLSVFWWAMFWGLEAEADRRCSTGEWLGEEICPPQLAKGRW